MGARLAPTRSRAGTRAERPGGFDRYLGVMCQRRSARAHGRSVFRLWYGSDAIQLVPVPGGTPRAREEDPFNAACSTHIDSTGAVSVTLHVAFQGTACTVVTQMSPGSSTGTK